MRPSGDSGGGNFQLVTRSGTNAFRGSLNYDFQHESLNANDFFYKKDGIEKPRARRNEGGFTVGGPIRRNRLFFFGGYQRTKAETGFVPTASSITVLPQALQLIDGARTHENLFAAFSALNPGILASIPKARCTGPSDTACISDTAVATPQSPESGHRRFHDSRPATGRRWSATTSWPDRPSAATPSFDSGT